MVQSMVVSDSDVKSEDLVSMLISYNWLMVSYHLQWRGTHKADVIDYKFNCILEAEQTQNGIDTSPEVWYYVCVIYRATFVCDDRHYNLKVKTFDSLCSNHSEFHHVNILMAFAILH